MFRRPGRAFYSSGTIPPRRGKDVRREPGWHVYWIVWGEMRTEGKGHPLKKGFQSIDDYIATRPEGTRKILENLRRTIRRAAPGAEEAISYQMPTFKLGGKNLVHFAAWKNHVGLYPRPSGTAAFQKDLARYKWAKGSIQFPLDEPLPYDLIKKIVEFRVREDLKDQSIAKGKKR